jgi:hypothetical protein
VLRFCQIELRGRCLKPRLGIVVSLPRNQLAVEEVLRPIEVRLREPQVSFALPDGGGRDLERRPGLIDLLEQLAILDLRERLAAPHGIAETY